MVKKVHRYADGGKIVKDHGQPERPRYYTGRPGFTGAVKDAVEAVANYASPHSLRKRKHIVDDKITKAGG
jgi:hypothetical protein